jgi:NitT/TauT family transport system substrate-binding protein
MLTAPRLLLAALFTALLAACAPAPTAPTPAAATPTPAGAGTQATSPATGQPPATTEPTSAGRPAPLSPRVSVKMGDPVFNPMAPVYIALDRGYFSDEGLDIQLVPFPADVAGEVSQVALGQLQFGMAGPDPGLFNAMERGVEIRLLASSVTNRETDKTAQLLVRTDLIDSGKFKGPADLKGARIAVPGEQSQFYVQRYLDRANVSADDVTWVRMNFADQLAAMKSGAIDAGWNVEPLATTEANQGLAKTVAITGELFPGANAQALIVSPTFARENPEAVRRYVYAYLRGLRDYYQAFVKNQGDRGPVVAPLVNHTPIKDPNMFNVIGMHSVDPNGILNIQTWDPFQEYFLKRGLQNTKLDLSKYVDQSYLNAALDRLGRLQ